MGQCLPAQDSQIKCHPLLGNLQSLYLKGQRYIDLKITTSSQQQYMNWSKNLNKLKYNSQINKILYLPLRQTFNNSQGFCQTNHQVTLRFKTFHQTLQDNLHKNISFNHYYRQAQIWHLIYTLIKYLKYFDRNIQNCINLTIHHIIIDGEGKLKVIPQIILPSFHHSFQINLYKRQRQSVNNKFVSNSVYIIATIALCLADLIYPTTFYDQANKKWKQISQQKRKKHLSNCSERYSNQLVIIIKQMTQFNSLQKLNLEELLKRLQVFEAEIHLEAYKNKYFGDSRQETGRDNYADLVSMKNSNLLLSQGTNRLWQSQVRFQQSKNEDKNTQQMQYPSIL